jgi:pSer/pThr/pTyr-binding forkhead associated (FHA) protein
MTADANEQGTVRYTRCATCGSMNPASAPACARCGAPQQLGMPAMPAMPPAANLRSPVPQSVPQVVCPKCQKTFPQGSKFCGYCGTPLPAAAPPAMPPPAPMPQPSVPPRTIASPGPLPRPNAPPQAPQPVMRPAGPPPAPRPAVGPPVPPRAVAPAPPPTRSVGPPPPRPAAPPPVPPPPQVPKPPAPVALGLPEGALEGTAVFSGFRAGPGLDARISEKRPDGTFGRSVSISKETVIGRENCDLSYPQDILLSPRHASVAMRDGKLVLKDLNSQNGSFIRQRGDTELVPGDVFLLGRELFRFVTQSLDEAANRDLAEGTVMWGVPRLQKGPLTAKLEHIKLNGEVVAEFKLDKAETTLGRTTGDLVFKDDPYMSGMHARIVAQPGRFLLQDLRSRNGVYRRVRAEFDLTDGDEFFMGEQLFRVDLKNVR